MTQLDDLSSRKYLVKNTFEYNMNEFTKFKFSIGEKVLVPRIVRMKNEYSQAKHLYLIIKRADISKVFRSKVDEEWNQMTIEQRLPYQKTVAAKVKVMEEMASQLMTFGMFIQNETIILKRTLYDWPSDLQSWDQWSISVIRDYYSNQTLKNLYSQLYKDETKAEKSARKRNHYKYRKMFCNEV